MVRILLADDDAALRRVLQFKLQQRGYDVTVAPDGAQALERIKEGAFDLLLSDMRMPRLSGIELLDQVKTVQPDLEVVLMTAYAEVAQAVQAVKLGAFDYLTKPFEDEQLFVTIEKALKFRKLENENRRLRGQLDSKRMLDHIIGVSAPFKQLMATVDKIAPTDATVLITGESGTGKELIARAIHLKSQRADSDFVVVNCAAIPRELIESELFGHVKGAFTGAVRDKRGKFELADRGTLFLDEIGELDIALQAKLLRAVQERVIEPLGGERKLPVDVRLLAATNVSLKERVASGAFREDLYYRLNVIPLHIPGLRERRDDIPILVKEFLRSFGKDERLSVDPALMARLLAHDWPGNVRELENLVERMVILRRTDRLSIDDLPGDFEITPSHGPANSEAAPEQGDLTFHEAEKKIILDALNRFHWNRSEAARHLNIPRHVLVYRMKKYALTEK